MALNRSTATTNAAFMADFTLPPRYTVLRPVGRGSFGTLVAAKDANTGKVVAIKRVEGGGGTMGTDRHETKKLLREMRLLQHFKHENIMCLHDILTPEQATAGGGACLGMGSSSGSVGAGGGGGAAAGGASDRGSSSDASGAVAMESESSAAAAAVGGSSAECTVGNGGSRLPSPSASWRQTFYLVQDLMDTDLHRVIQSAAKGQQALTENHIRCFCYQVVRGMYACHSAHVLHRDLKPSNLLVNKDCTLRIGDFGLARGVDAAATEANTLTEYVVTRWYRAPELLVGNEAYGPAIDLWSVGCILAEMLGRQPLFPGRDVLSQLRLIVQVVGVPEPQALRTVVRNEKAVDFILQIARQAPPPPPLSERFPNAPAGACDLLSRLLEFDPSKRISAADALLHPFLKPLHDLNTEPTAEKFDFSFESASDAELKGLLEAECCRFHPAGAAGQADPPDLTDPASTVTSPQGATGVAAARAASALTSPDEGMADSAGATASTASSGRKARLPPAAARGGVGKKRQR